MRHSLLIASLLLLAGIAPAHGQTFDDLIARADSLYAAGDYRASGEHFQMAFALKPGSSGLWYNAACAWALGGDADRAFSALETALQRGYRDVDLLTSDEDLAGLRDDPRWSGVVSDCRDARDAYLSTVNTELYNMFREDQADRRGDVDWEQVSPRDNARRARALEMVDEGLLVAADDFVHAAFIFQHGPDSTSYRMAHELAMEAVAIDSTYMRARWIAAAAKDRYLHSIGRPQIYGTQWRRIDGEWTMEPYDTTAVTDAERARWGVPPLSRQR